MPMNIKINLHTLSIDKLDGAVANVFLYKTKLYIVIFPIIEKTFLA